MIAAVPTEGISGFLISAVPTEEFGVVPVASLG